MIHSDKISKNGGQHEHFALFTKATKLRCQDWFFKAPGRGGVIHLQRGRPPPPAGEGEFFRVCAVTSLLITRFSFLTPQMKARDQAVRMRH